MSTGQLLAIAVGAGIAGWALEYAFTGAPRYSVLFEGRKIPFLPVYAAGGVAIALLAPELQGLPWYARAGVYGGSLVAVEAVAGLLDRATDHRSWDYEGKIVDLPHAAAWAALGLLAERALTD